MDNEQNNSVQTVQKAKKIQPSEDWLNRKNPTISIVFPNGQNVKPKHNKQNLVEANLIFRSDKEVVAEYFGKYYRYTRRRNGKYIFINRGTSENIEAYIND